MPDLPPGYRERYAIHLMADQRAAAYEFIETHYNHEDFFLWLCLKAYHDKATRTE